MSMSELYVDVNDTSTCSCGTSHEEPPTITVSPVRHSVLFIAPPTIARRTRNIGSQNEDYDVFLNCISTYLHPCPKYSEPTTHIIHQDGTVR